jgi:putative hydrolase of the HAD superfamily
MNGIRHIFFDLDNTIWDFEKSSMATLSELYTKYALATLGVPSFDAFVAAYKHRNELLWEEYRMGTVDKETLRNKRFALTFWDMGLDPDTAPTGMADDYVLLGPRRSHLFPHAHETLSYLQSKYTLHIITNGFAEAQTVKMETSDLNRYFSEVIISEHTGYKKPDIRIFRHSMEKAGATESECVMIGDGLEVDVLGAQQAGWRAIYFNPHQLPHDARPDHEIRQLDELLGIL